MSPIKKLREAVGMSQSAFAQAIGLSYSLVQQLEAGRRPSPQALEKLKTFAVEHGFADLALELSSEHWQIRRVIEPDDAQAPKNPVDFSPPRKQNNDRYAAHAMLDEIYESGDRGAISAVYQNLHTFVRLVRSLPAKPARKHK